MGARVEDTLDKMRLVLASGDAELAQLTIAGDDAIDELNLGLTERCYELLSLQQPVAGDLRLVVSVIRMAAELERVADLALRVVKLAATEHDALTGDLATFDLLEVLAERAIESFRHALQAWDADDIAFARELLEATSPTGYLNERLLGHLIRLDHPEAPRLAVRAAMAGQALDRIADHARVMAARVVYLGTGDPEHLAFEVR